MYRWYLLGGNGGRKEVFMDILKSEADEADER